MLNIWYFNTDFCVTVAILMGKHWAEFKPRLRFVEIKQFYRLRCIYYLTQSAYFACCENSSSTTDKSQAGPTRRGLAWKFSNFFSKSFTESSRIHIYIYIHIFFCSSGRQGHRRQEGGSISMGEEGAIIAHERDETHGRECQSHRTTFKQTGLPHAGMYTS